MICHTVVSIPLVKVSVKKGPVEFEALTDVFIGRSDIVNVRIGNIMQIIRDLFMVILP